jgi:hypothetical protein
MVSRIAGSSDARGEDIFSKIACKPGGATYGMIRKKACPGLDPGWKPVFGKDHAPTKARP